MFQGSQSCVGFAVCSSPLHIDFKRPLNNVSTPTDVSLQASNMMWPKLEQCILETSTSEQGEKLGFKYTVCGYNWFGK